MNSEKPRGKEILFSISILALVASNVGAILKPGIDIGTFKTELQMVKQAEAALEINYEDHKAQQQKSETSLARELGSIEQSISSINSNIAEMKTMQSRIEENLKR